MRFSFSGKNGNIIGRAFDMRFSPKKFLSFEPCHEKTCLCHMRTTKE